jgi:hypothetical protein
MERLSVSTVIILTTPFKPNKKRYLLPNYENVDEKSKTNRKIYEQRRYDQYSTELWRWRSCFESHCNFIDENRTKQLMTCRWYESKKEKELMPASQLPQSKRSNKQIKEI